MKTLLAIVFAAFFISPAVTTEMEVAPDCFKISSEEWGQQCSNPNSYKVKWRNSCNQTMDFKYALKRMDGRWSTGVILMFSQVRKLAMVHGHVKPLGVHCGGHVRLTQTTDFLLTMR